MATNYNDVDEILSEQNAQIQKLHDIVMQSIKEQDSLVKNRTNPVMETLSPGQRISDKVARFGGSWTFIITFMAVLIVWIAYNSLISKSQQFDPYPFILMNLVLSCVAALQAPVIMMSQNRQEEKDRERAEKRLHGEP